MMSNDNSETIYTGSEHFHDAGKELPFSLLDFWRWNGSNLLDNTTRGLLAEYLVAIAIDAKEAMRREWSTWDLTTPAGVRVEVKCAAYLQNWKQNSSPVIRFGIQPTRGWDATSGEYDSESKRQADYYVFCLFKPQERKTANPLQIEQWAFYVLSANILNANCPSQKSIGLPKLIALGARERSWEELSRYPFERSNDAETGDD